MSAKNIDWEIWGSRAKMLYADGLTFVKVSERLNEEGLKVTPSGVHAFLSRNGLIRSNSEAQRISFQSGSREVEKECLHCERIFISKIGNQKWCKVCVPDDESGHRMRRYGISNPEFLAILESQGGHCALCSRTQKLVVDHDHRTDVVRGILCYRCNISLGTIDDDQTWARRAMRYSSNLHDELPPGSFTPELIGELKNLSDRATELHIHNHGPGGDWNGRPDFYCCFGA